MWSTEWEGRGGHPSIWDPALLPGPEMVSGAGCGTEGVAGVQDTLRGPEHSCSLPLHPHTRSGRQGRKGVQQKWGRLNRQPPCRGHESTVVRALACNGAGAFPSLLRRQRGSRNGAVAQDK